MTSHLINVILYKEELFNDRIKHEQIDRNVRVNTNYYRGVVLSSNYVPDVKIFSNGQEISPQLLIHVKEVTVIDRINLPSTCVIRIADNMKGWINQKEFQLGKSLSIKMSYKDKPDLRR